MDHLTAIDLGVRAGLPYHEIARKIYLTYPTKVFVGSEEQQYEILNEISTFFETPITSIHVAGSAKTGRSLHKGLDFVHGTSDLDIAVIDARLFIKYAEIVFIRSKGYSDQTGFPIRSQRSTYEEYIRYLSRGIFRPDLMTTGDERAKWNNFFGKLSGKHTRLFSSISASIYLSQTFFETKQRSSIKCHLESRPL